MQLESYSLVVSLCVVGIKSKLNTCLLAVLLQLVNISVPSWARVSRSMNYKPEGHVARTSIACLRALHPLASAELAPSFTNLV